MKARSYVHFFIITCVAVFVFALPIVFSRAQQDLQDLTGALLQSPSPAVTEEQIRERIEAQRRELLTNRIPHFACANCFKVGDGRFGVYEEAPRTGILFPREIPDPAPLRKDTVRPSITEEGEKIWHIGDQGFVGPTDEEPVSADLPIPKIELKRIKARHMERIFNISGVHAFGIGAQGFVVSIDPKQTSTRYSIPHEIEGIPVGVEEADFPRLKSHRFLVTRPVPVGAGINVPLPRRAGGVQGNAFGTVGPTHRER